MHVQGAFAQLRSFSTRVALLAVVGQALIGCPSKTAPSPSEATKTSKTKKRSKSDEPREESGHALAGPRVHAVIVGVLEFGEPGVAGWSKVDRKDRELYDALLARGVPKKNITLLLDRKAGHAAVFSALKAAARKVKPEDTFLFYYAGHGVRDGDGAAHFMAYDTRTGQFDATGLAIARIGKTVAELSRGRRAFLMADACYSGALARAADTISKRGDVQAISLTSAEASNVSTNNWTFTQTLLDGLSGDPLMDRDGDGAVTLGEVAEAVADGMKYREKQRHGYHRKPGADGLVLANASAPAPERGTGALAVGRYVLAPRDGQRQVAQIRAQKGSRRVVRFYDYNHGIDRTLSASKLKPITFERYPKGARLRVFWGKDLYDAKVLRREDDFHLITYPGWGAEWNEWVMSDRIASDANGADAKVAKGDRIEVEWRGSWWPATVRKRRSGRYLIHYTDYGDDWDEWVGPDRIRQVAER
jgi:hypothetical protein